MARLLKYILEIFSLKIVEQILFKTRDLVHKFVQG